MRMNNSSLHISCRLTANHHINTSLHGGMIEDALLHFYRDRTADSVLVGPPVRGLIAEKTSVGRKDKSEARCATCDPITRLTCPNQELAQILEPINVMTVTRRYLPSSITKPGFNTSFQSREWTRKISGTIGRHHRVVAEWKD